VEEETPPSKRMPLHWKTLMGGEELCEEQLSPTTTFFLTLNFLQETAPLQLLHKYARIVVVGFPLKIGRPVEPTNSFFKEVLMSSKDG